MKKPLLIKTFFLLLFLLTYRNPINAMNENAIISVKSKNYPCTECEKSFINKCNLTRHMHLHTGKNLFQCALCTKQFNYNSEFTIHMRTHTGEKPYLCHLCHKSFTLKCNLEIHMR